MIVIIQKQIELYAKKIVILIILFMKMILVEILNLLLEKNSIVIIAYLRYITQVMLKLI